MRRWIYISIVILSVFGLEGCVTTRKGQPLQDKHEDTVRLSVQDRRKYDYFFLEAVRMKQKGDYDAAYELFSHCLDINPRSGAVLYELAQFYLFLGQQEKGEEALKLAVRSDEDNFWYKQILASFYMQKRDVPKAIAVYENMADQFPGRLEPLMSLVELYSKANSYQQVIHTLNRIEELDGKSEQISMEKFRMYLALEDKEKAFTEIDNLSKEYPYDMRYKTLLGDAYMESGEQEKAYHTYREVLDREPGDALALLSLASYYEKTNQDSLFRLQLDTVLVNENVPSDSKMEIMRHLILQSEQTTKDSTRIISYFHKILEKPQPNADMAMLCAQYLITKKMEKESVPVLEQVLALDPENKPARLQLLSYAIRENDLERVAEISRPALQYNPDALEFYYYLGISYYQRNKTDKALDVFLRGVKQINENSDKQVASDFYAILGDIYHVKNMHTEAYAAYDSSLVYNPDNIGALNNYAYYLSVERSNLDKAEEMSYRTVKAEPENFTYLDTYAWILFEKGKYTEARIYIEQALKCGGEDSRVILEHCGDIYSLCGEKEKAVDCWKRADSLKPADEDRVSEEDIKRLKKKIALQKYIAE